MKRLTLPVAAIAMTLSASYAFAGPDWQTNPICRIEEFIDPADYDRCRSWIAAVKQPVVKGLENQSRASCCSEADAYEADQFELKRCATESCYYAIITRDYPNVAAGTRIFIPPAKFNEAYAEGGNPTGHGVVFLSTTADETGQLSVLCYFGPALQ